MKAKWAALAAVTIGAGTLAYYFLTKPKPGEGEPLPGPLEEGPVTPGSPGSEAPAGGMPEPIVQEPTHYGEPVSEPDDYLYLAQDEREMKRECPWDNMRFDTLSGCFHHILEDHGGMPGPMVPFTGETTVLEGKVPLLRYQKIPVLVQVRDPEGNPVIGQLVELKSVGGAIIKAEYTDGTGSVDFLNLDPGQYSIAIDALPAYSRFEMGYNFDFQPERVTLTDFSGNPVVMEFMQPYLENIQLKRPGWTVIQQFAPAVIEAPAPAPEPAPAPGPIEATVESITITDALNAKRAGHNILVDKIMRHDANLSVTFSHLDLILIAELRG